MIGGIGSIHLKPSIGTAGPGTELFQGGATSGTKDVGTTSFSEALSQAATKTVGNLENAEMLSVEALKGNADTRQVVDAVMSAQQTLQAAVAIRDKIVSAYLEVSRMSI
ncbi:flagellar hook-basal body protein FliE [Mesorhizobium sp. Root157]|uniref:flagellar hook-basal body complex protein FliE n=1 Tax=Mesorhizobium sp. Root157 TaxID=1736477 RepID=UPI0006F3A915|nr:flagellar hook-basal body complex protein FliE [Mesorhizobium sp. Root157]KQZ87012.1 flagellar hook-basal body protein FliE [Mesorhizobium sp. Root157]